jgi:hypothetical protein
MRHIPVLLLSSAAAAVVTAAAAAAAVAACRGFIIERFHSFLFAL